MVIELKIDYGYIMIYIDGELCNLDVTGDYIGMVNHFNYLTSYLYPGYCQEFKDYYDREIT